jgi:recombination protein RecR
MVLFLLRHPDSLLSPILSSMQKIREDVKTCECGNISESNPCTICGDTTRNKETVCVVEDVTSMWAIERAKCFNGIYYVMGKLLSPTNGIGPDDLDIAGLKKYVEARCSTEVILALNPTVEGQATAHYIQEMLGSIKCSRLRLGIPMGGELDYLDTGTISAALAGRG